MLTTRLAEVVHQSTDLTSRIRTLSNFLTTENAASQVQRMAARHPPNIRFIRKLAEGQTGSVHEVAAPGMPRHMAVKIMDWSTRDQRVSIAKRVATEVSVLTSLEHPLLPKLYQVYNAGNEFCIAMTLCNQGTLWHLIQAQGGLPLEKVQKYVAELVVILDLLHRNDIIYVDLKPENILLQDFDHVMLCDFDLAHTSAEVEQIAEARHQEERDGLAGPPMFWGTLDYAAPEVVTYGASAYTPASDWWAVGVLMYEMLYSVAPFARDTDDDTMTSICQGEVFIPDGPVQLDAATEDLMLHLLCVDPTLRMGSEGGGRQILAHPFFSGLDLDKLLLQAAMDRDSYDPL